MVAEKVHQIMPISKPIYQLTLPLELEEAVSDQQSAVSPEEARVRSETARAALNDLNPESAPWKEEYLNLVDGGWNWRVAAYIAWAASPKNTRTPKTQDELARQHLGLTSDRAINTWRRKNPAIDEMVAVLQAAPLFAHRAEIYEALVKVATSPEYKGHNDRKLALELLGDYVPRSKVEAELNQKIMDDLSSLPFEEKLRLAGLKDPEKLAEFKKKFENRQSDDAQTEEKES